MTLLFSALLLAAGLLTAHTCSTKDAAPALPTVSGAFAGTQEMPAVITAATGSFVSTID